MTRFLEVPGAPLDNNICEQSLKRCIQHRKNSLFYKTEHGAYIGDLFMSLIHTCNLMQVNPFDYLVTLIKNACENSNIPEKEACDMLLFRKPELSEYHFQRAEVRKSGLSQIQPDKKRQRKPPW